LPFRLRKGKQISYGSKHELSGIQNLIKHYISNLIELSILNLKKPQFFENIYMALNIIKSDWLELTMLKIV